MSEVVIELIINIDKIYKIYSFLKKRLIPTHFHAAFAKLMPELVEISL